MSEIYPVFLTCLVLVHASVAIQTDLSDDVVYQLSFQKQGEVHCQPCAELGVDPSSFRYFEDESGDEMCCASNPVDVIKMVDWRMGLMRSQDEVREPRGNSVSVHALLSTHRIRPHHHHHGDSFQQILKPEWSVDRDYTYCHSGSPSTAFCQEFQHEAMSESQAYEEGIRLPFDGRYTINCKIAWEKSDPGNPKWFMLWLYRRPTNGEKELLAVDTMSSDCSHQMFPCATVVIRRTFRLSKDDELFIEVSHKRSIIRESELTYLEISGVSSA